MTEKQLELTISFLEEVIVNDIINLIPACNRLLNNWKISGQEVYEYNLEKAINGTCKISSIFLEHNDPKNKKTTIDISVSIKEINLLGSTLEINQTLNKKLVIELQRHLKISFKRYDSHNFKEITKGFDKVRFIEQLFEYIDKAEIDFNS